MYKSPRRVPTLSTLESTPLRESRGERERERERERVHVPFTHSSPPDCQVFSGGRGECGDRC